MEPQNIPFFAHEGIMARMERTVKRLWIALIITIVLIFASNAMWLHCWMQYDYTSETSTYDTVQIDSDRGNANFIGGDGEINNGEDNSEELPKKAKITH